MVAPVVQLSGKLTARVAWPTESIITSIPAIIDAQRTDFLVRPSNTGSSPDRWLTPPDQLITATTYSPVRY